MPIPQVNPHHIERMERAAIVAARSMAETFRSGEVFTHEYKSDDSLVLSVDLKAQELILRELGNKIPVVAEEDPASHAYIGTEGEYYLVDPLDGTASAKRFRGIEGGQVGFGPLIGLALGGTLAAAVFVSLPARRIFTAIVTQGVRTAPVDLFSEAPISPFLSRSQLTPAMPESLRQCGVLFFPGARGEVPLVQSLRSKNIVENMYRFGGFASDTVRLAQGFEQIQIQFSVKAWDFSATLFTQETGYQTICDPLGRKVNIAEWKISAENPLISAPYLLTESLFEALGIG
jgi:fructose-1,6-bisphosphatase/inositol monophosphatase family enzyme